MGMLEDLMKQAGSVAEIAQKNPQAVAAVLVSLVPPTWPPLPWLRRPADGEPPPGSTDRTEPAPGG